MQFLPFTLLLAAAVVAPSAHAAAPKPGKYGCTATKYVRGSYESQPRGSVVFGKDGKYQYLGFEKPSSGTWKSEGALVRLQGGYLNGGEAKPIEGREGRYYLVFPANPDNRWTCGFIG